MKSVVLVVFGVALVTAISWWFWSSRPVVHVVAPAAPTRTPMPSLAASTPVNGHADTGDQASGDEVQRAAPGTRPDGRTLHLPDVVTG